MRNGLKIIRYGCLLGTLMLLFVANIFAQDCYSDNRSKGVSAYNNGKYAEAKKYFQSAQNCDMKPRQNDVADWIGKCDEKLKSAAVQGALNGVFSVSPTKKVVFSKGNLQYRASTNTWRFAEHQYDVVGSANKNISSYYSGWIDLFGWGTSGYNNKKPYMTSTNMNDYGNGSNNIARTNYDWGVYNKISNGGNQTSLWRTLTNSEWDYIINKRSCASSKKGIGCVNGVNGLILLPDNWTLPSGLTFRSGVANSRGSAYYKTINNYTVSEWSKMEANGAVFLPATGWRRDGADVDDVGSFGCYWSSSALVNSSFNSVCDMNFGSDYVHTSDPCFRDIGISVRLVKDVK